MAEGGKMETTKISSTAVQNDDFDKYLFNDEYETQLLGNTPTSLFDKLYECFYDYTSDAIKSVEGTLVKECSDIMAEADIQQGCNNFFDSCIEKLDHTFDRFETFAKNNRLKIPKHVVLPEDQIHEIRRTQAVNEEMSSAELDKESLELLKLINVEQKRRAVLIAKQKEQESVVKNLMILEHKVEEVKTMLLTLDFVDRDMIQSRLQKELAGHNVIYNG